MDLWEKCNKNLPYFNIKKPRNKIIQNTQYYMASALTKEYEYLNEVSGHAMLMNKVN